MIEENGTGLPDANSYVSLDDFAAYCSERGLTIVREKSVDEIAALAIRATQIIDAEFVFRSVKLTDNQALECPRFGETEISRKLKSAVIELAILLAKENPLQPVRTIAAKEVTAGKVSTKTTYDPLAKPVDPLAFIAKLLRGVASRPNGSVQVGMMTL